MLFNKPDSGPAPPQCSAYVILILVAPALGGKIRKLTDKKTGCSEEGCKCRVAR